MLKESLSNRKHFVGFILPAFVIYTFFWILPLLSNIPLSLLNWNGLTALSEAKLAGIRNYVNMFQDQIFLLSLKHNVIYTVSTLVLKLVLALAVAILLDRFVRFKAFFRTVFFFPTILPFIVVSFLWLWIYNPSFGLLNTFLDLIGLDSLKKPWLGNPSFALGAIILAEVWRSVPFFMLIFLAGLQGVPKELEEAAQIDGASFGQVLRNIIIPQLQPVINVVAALILIDGFRLFESIYVMTNGGPGYYSTEVLSTYIFKSAFSDLRMGYGASMSVFLAIIVFTVSALYLKFLAKPNDE